MTSICVYVEMYEVLLQRVLELVVALACATVDAGGKATDAGLLGIDVVHRGATVD